MPAEKTDTRRLTEHAYAKVMHAFKRDDRRNKSYERVVEVGMLVPRDIRSAQLHQRMPELPEAATRYYVDDRAGMGTAFKDERPLSIHYTFAADRPSEIMDAQEAFDRAEAMIPVIETRIRQLAEEAAEHKRYERVAGQAEQIGAHVAEQAAKAAKEATRFEQRMAALRAEYQAELDVQARKLEREGVFESVGVPDDFEPESRAVAREAFDRFIDRRKDVSGFPRTPVRLTADEVGPLLEKARKREGSE